ncbi:2-polyprenyl-6-methoxyphenol hydroxylase [Amycolatopsis lurida]|uniref:2-polyprenyl-6-methoxyphenol hydroxylase n=1 Tax=Amycolatopsis lurida NRRL 2430 TaxID=1460371 RepID=A0A2P2FMJ1_AMYLU|nr:FAD-dependent monooxygenase [Amycolatopsis lurida]KFU77948.1 2-polyprenyl-6-methoxyphenol hydroxylase [Amycolatopsis lurida NRRL 2430]SEB30066.1 2-polyprenyl-6-methoxyphenol hydroxylase [Amycolatopsis lurida]
MNDVIIVGGGPVGLLLAGELRLAGADPLVLEASDGAVRRNRSFGLRGINGRTSQSLRLRGLTEEFSKAQKEASGASRLLKGNRARGHFAGLPLVEDEVSSGAAGGFVLKQHVLERILADWAIGLGVRVRTDCEVVDLVDEDSAVRAVLADGRSEQAAYLVGCDGGRSVVRKRAGIAFPGTDATMTGRVALAELADPGAVESTMHGPGGMVRTSLVPGEISTMEFDGGPGDRDAPLTAEEMQTSIARVSGVGVDVIRFGGGIRFSDNTRLAATYRRGRVLLAGDAAHVHSPIGGQGLNLGLQDAMNLGWKLGLVARGLALESLLDSYTAERRPVGERVLRNTRAQVALLRPGPQVAALREVLAETLEIPAAKRHFIAMGNGADIDYAPDAAHPLVGRFAPLPPMSEDGRAVLVARDDEVRAAANGRVRLVEADVDQAFLVRPDGYVAWAAPDGETTGLTEALAFAAGDVYKVKRPFKM